MGLAERFKKTLGKTDIFINNKQCAEVKDIENQEEKYVTATNISDSNIPAINTKQVHTNKFPELTTEAIEKVKKTPFWNEYSMKSQEKMISKYFDIKIKRGKYAGTKYSLTDKLTFIEDVLKTVI